MTAYDIPASRLLEVKQYRAASVLEAAGAWSLNGFIEIPFCSERVTFEVRYTKDAGASSGAWKARLTWKLAGVDDDEEDESMQLLLDQTQFTIGGSDDTGQVEVRDGVIQGPATASAAVQSRVFTALAPDGVRAVKLELAETGDTGNPGIVEVIGRARRT